ncbi:NUDIX hydrolase [Streptomyces sp. NPDC048362]|uniref:NUDIX hydrolase n=1 Tax=Streptomyces sp. NPDC048362 TaxID=3365539 RepID=UPI003724A3D3
MTREHVQGPVQAVVLYDGRVLLVCDDGGGWRLPSGGVQPAESAEATAARVVYELTGYLVDGTEVLDAHGEPADGEPAVVCQLLSEAPSDGARLVPERVRWTPIADTADAALPTAVRAYLQGHAPV